MPNVTSVSASDLQATGLTRVEDVLNNLPMVFAGQNSTVSNGADGTAEVDLRGLGAKRTLVLVNGRRLAPGSAANGAIPLRRAAARRTVRRDRGPFEVAR